MKTPTNKAILQENNPLSAAANDPISPENKRQQNELKDIVDYQEAYIDHFKKQLFQHYQQLLQEKKEFEDEHEKKLFSELKTRFDELWKNYLEKQSNISKLNEYQELLKKHLAELQHFLNEKINYLRNFIENINKEIDLINTRMNQRQDKIISQYNSEIRAAYPKVIADPLIDHLNNTVYKKFRNNQIPANQLQQAIHNELSKPEVTETLAAQTNVDSQRFARTAADFVQKLEDSVNANLELHKDLLDQSEDENLKLLQELLKEQTEDQLKNCEDQLAKLDGVAASMDNDKDVSVESVKYTTNVATDLMNNIKKNHSTQEVALKSDLNTTEQLVSQKQEHKDQLAKLGEKLKTGVDSNSIKFR